MQVLPYVKPLALLGVLSKTSGIQTDDQKWNDLADQGQMMLNQHKYAKS